MAFASFVLGLGCGDGDSGPEGARQPPELAGQARKLSGEATSHSGRYRIGLRPAAPVRLGTLHEWIVRIERSDGTPARPTNVAFDGGMPAHGHGFVTAPRVTRDLGDGEFLVEGVKFHMAGAWELRVAVTDSEGSDHASFEVSVAP